MDNNAMSRAAAKWALSKIGCSYSQEKRTQKDIFDCSSLVARAYSAQGKKWRYGGSIPRSNQEVYDDEFELLWPESYTDIGKRFGGKSVLQLATQPGDLQFLCTEPSTRRKNKITHVAMIADASKIVHARGKAYGVCTNAIYHYGDKVCAVSQFNPMCTLRNGMKGSRTLALQQALNKYGAGLKTDGEYGEATETAVRVYQAQSGLPETGRADLATLRALDLRVFELDIPAEATQSTIDTVNVFGKTVNLRTGPGTNYLSKGIARKGDTFEAVDTSGWHPILANGEILWISQRYTRLTKTEKAQEV